MDDAEYHMRKDSDCRVSLIACEGYIMSESMHDHACQPTSLCRADHMRSPARHSRLRHYTLTICSYTYTCKLQSSSNLIYPLMLSHRAQHFSLFFFFK